MEQMTSALADKTRVQAASHVHGGNADHNRPLELVRPREDDCRHVRSQLEQVLEGSFNCREGSAVVAFDFLAITLVL
jgi:hypothetical protein